MSKEVFFTINSDTKKAVTSIKELQDEIKRLSKEWKSTEDVIQRNKLGESLKSAKSELKGFNDTLREGKSFTEKLTDSVVDGFKKVGVAIGAAYLVDKVIDFGKASIQTAREVERDETRLLTALNGRKSIQQTLITQANDLEKRTGVDDREIVKQETFLALQGRTQIQIEKTIEASIRLSKTTGEDLDGAVKKLDATFEGSVGKLGKLDERFTTLTKDQLENGEAIDLINEKYKNNLDLQTDADKAANDFSNSTEDLEKAFGKLLIKLSPVVSLLSQVVSGLANLGKTSKDFQIELNVGLTEDNKKFAVKEFQDFRSRLIKEGKTFEDANAQALKSKINEAVTLSKSSQERGDFKQTLIYKAELDAISELANQDLENFKSVEKKKTDEQTKASKERQKLTEEQQKKSIELQKKVLDDGFKDVQGAGKQNLEGKTKDEKILAERENLINEQKYFEDNGNKLVQIGKITSGELVGIKSDYVTKIKDKEKELSNFLLGESKTVADSLNLEKQIQLQGELNDIDRKLLTVKKYSKEENDLIRQKYEKEAEIKENAVDKEITDLKLKQNTSVGLDQLELTKLKSLEQQKVQIHLEAEKQITVNQSEEQKVRDKQTKEALKELRNGFFAISSEIVGQINEASRNQSDLLLKNLQDGTNQQIEELNIRQQKEQGTFVEKSDIEKKYDQKRLELQKKQAAEERKIKTEQFKKDKDASIIQSLINTSVAIVAGLSKPAIPPFPSAIAAGVIGGIQTALIASRPIPQFTSGGLLDGPLHSGGGIPLVNSHGKILGEAEGGEIILNRNVSKSKPLTALASYINEMTGGRSFSPSRSFIMENKFLPNIPRFDSGGIVGSSSNTVIDLSNLTKAVDNLTIQSQQPLRSYVVEQEISGVQNKNAIIERRSKLYDS